MTTRPAVGEWRRFPWDDYASRWFVARFEEEYLGQVVVILQRENRPHYVDCAQITLSIWETGIKP